MEKAAEKKMRNESVVHIRDEYSTWDWIMSGMLKSAGFEIETEENPAPNQKIYICSKRV
jgi:hypothetical protein